MSEVPLYAQSPTLQVFQRYKIQSTQFPSHVAGASAFGDRSNIDSHRRAWGLTKETIHLPLGCL